MSHLHIKVIVYKQELGKTWEDIQNENEEEEEESRTVGIADNE